MDRSVVIALMTGLIVGCINIPIAKQRNRNPVNWFFIGFLFSLLGLLLLIALPSRANESSKVEDVKVPDIKKAPHAEAAAIPDGPLFPSAIQLRVSRDSTIDWYFIDQRSDIIGPLKLNELRKALIERKLDNQTYIWCEEFPDWTQIYQLQNGASLLDPDFL